MEISNLKTKQKDEILRLIDMQILFSTDETKTYVDFDLVEVKQNSSAKLYTTAMACSFAFSLICRLPRTMQNPEGIQRALKTSKITSIASKHALSYTSPNSIVLNFNTENVPNIIEIIGSKDNKVKKLRINLKEYRKHIEACEINEDGYLKDPEKQMLGFLIDAHHRTEGAYKAKNLDYEFVTSVYIDLSKELMAKVFADINQYQEKPSSTHTLAIRYMAGLLADKDSESYQIINYLNDNNTVFHNRINTYDGNRSKELPTAFIKGESFHKLLTNNFVNILSRYDLEGKAKIINYYFEAWKDIYPNAWDNTHHVLTKSMGISIVSKIFEKINNAVLIRGDGSLTKEGYKDIIRKCFFANNKPIEIKVSSRKLDDNQVEESYITLNWESESFGSYSSGKGINSITNELMSKINDFTY